MDGTWSTSIQGESIVGADQYSQQGSRSRWGGGDPLIPLGSPALGQRPGRTFPQCSPQCKVRTLSAFTPAQGTSKGVHCLPEERITRTLLQASLTAGLVVQHLDTKLILCCCLPLSRPVFQTLHCICLYFPGVNAPKALVILCPVVKPKCNKLQSYLLA